MTVTAKELREALVQRCWQFLLNDNKKARSTVIAAHEFADFVEQEIAAAEKQKEQPP